MFRLHNGAFEFQAWSTVALLPTLKAGPIWSHHLHCSRYYACLEGTTQCNQRWCKSNLFQMTCVKFVLSWILRARLPIETDRQLLVLVEEIDTKVEEALGSVAAVLEQVAEPAPANSANSDSDFADSDWERCCGDHGWRRLILVLDFDLDLQIAWRGRLWMKRSGSHLFVFLLCS